MPIRIHGHSGNQRLGIRPTPTYRSWQSMWRRCTDPSEVAYPRYGAKGITVCARWTSFANFLRDMGERPKDTTLDRIKNSRGYSPKNCRWATRREQVINSSHVIWITVCGTKYILKEACSKYGVNYGSVRALVGQNRSPHAEEFFALLDGIQTGRLRRSL